MKITRNLLLSRGFKKKKSDLGYYYVLGKWALAYSYKWQLCNYETGIPYSELIYVNSMEELDRMIEEGRFS